MKLLKRIGIIDIGSNSIRLVVFDGPKRTPLYLYNEKVFFRLGMRSFGGKPFDTATIEAVSRIIHRYVAICRNMEINKIIDIEPESFKPVPKVKSTLLVFTPKKNYYNLKDPKNLEHVTNIFFSQRRKMIKKPLKFLFKNYEEISSKLNLDLTLRPQNLNNLTYYKICEIYEALI